MRLISVRTKHLIDLVAPAIYPDFRLGFYRTNTTMHATTNTMLTPAMPRYRAVTLQHSAEVTRDLRTVHRNVSMLPSPAKVRTIHMRAV